MAALDKFDDPKLTARAKETNPRVKRWVSVSGGGSRRVYTCNLCEALIDSRACSAMAMSATMNGRMICI